MKKPIEWGRIDKNTALYECPDCGNRYINIRMNYCFICGLKFDWSEVEETKAAYEG